MSTILATQVRKHAKGPARAAGRYWKGKAPKGATAVSDSDEEEEQQASGEEGDVPMGGEHDVEEDQEEEEELPTKTLPVKSSKINVTLRDVAISQDGKVIVAGREESGRTAHETERDAIANEAEEMQKQRELAAEERKKESHNLVAESIRRELAESEECSYCTCFLRLRMIAGEKEDIIPDVDDTDGLDPEAEFEAWRLRELGRIKKEKEEELRREEEREEIERRRALPEEQRMKEDLERAKKSREEKPKGQQKFLQKYWHKGAFHQDDEILKRHDYTEATESTMDVSLLPKVMQVKNFGKRSRTKYTHLLDQDTTVGTGGFGGTGSAKSGGFSTEGGGCFLCGGPHLKKGRNYPDEYPVLPALMAPHRLPAKQRMDIYMTRVALAAGEDDVKIALAKVLHRPPFPINPLLNFDVFIFRRYDSRGKTGILSLPTVEAGHIFLRSYGGSSGFHVKGSRICFQTSKKPVDQSKVERLLSTPWQDPLVLQQERERMTDESKPYDLAQFAFGRFLADGKFVSECTAQGVAEVACDLERRQVCFTFRKQQRHSQSGNGDFALFIERITLSPSPDPVISALYHPSRIDAVLESGEEDSPVIFLRANVFPTFTLEMPNILNRSLVSRIQGFIPGRSMPPGCFSLMCTFKSQSDRRAFVHACSTRFHVRHTVLQNIPVIQGDDSSNEEELHHLLSRLPFEVAFEVEKAVSNLTLTPTGVVKLQDKLLELCETHSEHVVAMLRKFIACLEENGPTRGRRRRRRRSNAPGGNSLVERLKRTVDDFLAEQASPKGKLAPSNTAASYTFQLILTPTRYILEGPNADQSNSVLRRFGNNECFLRVSFQDENRSKLRGGFDLSISGLMAERYRPVLVNGCQVAGRGYQLLGYSMSGLKEHSMWFVRPFRDADGREWDANAIRNSLGDFSRLQHQPARLGARWSQAFSATDPSITVESNEIRKIDDRKSPLGTVMTDGCSPISTGLMRAIWKAYLGSKKQTKNKKHPSALQFRLGGSKGMVVEDPTLDGKVVCLRPSQIKFDADNRTFDIQATSVKPKAMFLNRPLIALLEHLGADCNHIVELQNASIEEANSLHNSLEDASKVLQQHGLGASFNLPSLFNNMRKILHLDFEMEDGQEGYRSDLLANALQCSETHVLRELKYRAHIAVPGSFTLLGVSDEWDCLEEGEIYATVSDDRKGIYEKIKGVVAITRSPQIHPGDVQLVKAVRRRELEHLTNVVVFSCRGNRPLASCLGGGDLDGDDFNLILDPKLHPKRTAIPGAYKSLPIKTTPHPCGISDVVDFIFDYIESDLVGQISIMHLRFADRNGPDCADCLKLAEHASHAVDFPKTGTPVKFQDIPKLKKQPKPDFLSHEGRDPTSDQFYPSPKLLGRLFRRVPLEHWAPEEWHEPNSPSKGEIVEDALRRVGLYGLGLPALDEPSEELYEEMRCLLDEYCDQLTTIGKAHTLSKNKDIVVSESELVSGTLMANWSDHHRRREAVTAMNMQTHELVRAVRFEIRAKEADHQQDENQDFWDEDGYDDEEDFYRENRLIAEHFRRAWAAWYVAEEALDDYPAAYGPQSFGFIALGRMLELIKAARELV
ncbi:hypothetical protein ID866_5806 [Astraeus odoratus]|nr:hypothetical protein ID866_5806 [Astraeus odoratus]